MDIKNQDQSRCYPYLQ